MKNKNMTFDEHMDKKYGKRGAPSREKFEEDAKIFALGAMLHDLRKQQGLTQAQLAEKCGTTKSYISRIENDASDIRISTLVRIIEDGFGRRLSFAVSK
jgi:DNA-binding XRE family transcriptional regulator